MEQFIKKILKICKASIAVLLIFLAVGCNSNDDIGSVRLDNDCLMASRNLYPTQTTSAYLLPWAIGQTFLVSQGNCTNNSHRAHLNQQFAYDFAMPMRTQICAAREGTVIAVHNGLTAIRSLQHFGIHLRIPRVCKIKFPIKQNQFKTLIYK